MIDFALYLDTCERYAVYVLYRALTSSEYNYQKQMIYEAVNSDYINNKTHKSFYDILKLFDKKCLPIDSHSICLFLKEQGLSVDEDLFNLHYLEVKELKHKDFYEVMKTISSYQKQRMLVDYIQKTYTEVIGIDPLKINNKIESIKNGLNDFVLKQSSVSTLQEILLEGKASLKDEFENGLMQDFKSDYEELDYLVQFNRHQFNIIAGRPSHGKTTFALNLALNFEKKGYKTLFFSMEMSKKELSKKIISVKLRTNDKYIKANYNDYEKNIDLVINKHNDHKMFASDVSNVTVQDVEVEIETLKNRGHIIDVVIIDYLGLMDTSGDHFNRVSEVAYITRELKKLAKRKNIMIIALCQLSRDIEKANNRKPKLSDLRESGSIEQDADIVMFVHREYRVSKKEEDKNKLTIIVEKHRNGEIGEFDLLADLSKSCITNIERFK